MAHQAFTLPSYPKCIRSEDFELIKSIDTFELYQSDYYYGSLLPVLSEEQFLTIHSFESYAGFQTYLFDINERDWTSNNASVSCTWEQFEKDWDSGIAELAEATCADYSADEDDEEGYYHMPAYDQPYTKGCDVRANRRKNSWLAQKKTFRTEEILRAKEHKEDRELKQKVKSIQKTLLRSRKAPSKEEALKMAETMVCLKPNVSFTRVRFALVSYKGTEEIEVCPYKKRAAKTFHEKHKAMKKCAAYHERLQEIRDMTRKVPGHNRKGAKHACNIKQSEQHNPTPESQETTFDFVIHPAYNNAIVRVVSGKHLFSFEMDVHHTTPVNLLLSKCPITGRILSILCTLQNR